MASNSGTIFSGFRSSLYNHEIPGVTANTVLADLRKRLSVIKDAYVLTIPPPPVQGLGKSGGFQDDAGGSRGTWVGMRLCMRRMPLLLAGQQGPQFCRGRHPV